VVSRPWVAEDLVQGGLGQGAEGVVGGREHGDALGAVDSVGLLDRGNQRGQLRAPVAAIAKTLGASRASIYRNLAEPRS
jgi:hypothetical protein